LQLVLQQLPLVLLLLQVLLLLLLPLLLLLLFAKKMSFTVVEVQSLIKVLYSLGLPHAKTSSRFKAFFGHCCYCCHCYCLLMLLLLFLC
jgi:hypothetical protein